MGYLIFFIFFFFYSSEDWLPCEPYLEEELAKGELSVMESVFLSVYLVVSCELDMKVIPACAIPVSLIGFLASWLLLFLSVVSSLGVSTFVSYTIYSI